MKKISWGIIGLGNMALQFADAFKYVKNANLKAISSKNLHKLNNFREKFNIPNNVQGVIVLNVETNSDASKKGILPGDIIREVSQNQIFSPLDLQNRLQEEIKASRDFALLLINRKGNLSYIAVKINKN